jgi:DNA-binding LacI/PurR family transcriptional regulator
MNKKPRNKTIDDVADLAGVSISTVSRVLNRNVPVSEDTVARVEAAIRTLKYVPKAAARNLARQKTNTLGLLASEVVGDFFVPLLAGIEGVAREAGYDLLISTAARHGPHDHLPSSLGAHNTDGLLVFTGSLTNAGIEHAHAQGVLMVLIHQSTPDHLPIPCITIENKAAARDLVRHLIQVHGRRRIALLRGLPQHEDTHWREEGYCQALSENGLVFDPDLALPGDFHRNVARASVTRLIDNGRPFDAIFTGDDEAAVGALEALQARGIRVPEDVSLVGFDDQNLATVVKPPLTTVHTPTGEVGRVAAQQLLRLIRNQDVDRLTLLPTDIVIRQSCGCHPEPMQAGNGHGAGAVAVAV